MSVACDAEKSSWDADLFAEDAAGQKMRRTNRVRGEKIDKRIAKVVFDAEACAPGQIHARTAPENRKTR